MCFKEHQNLDVTGENASKKELEKLKRKYKVTGKHNVWEMILCIGITTIATIIIIILYSNIIELVSSIIACMFAVYFVTLLMIVLSVCNIIRGKNIKMNIWQTVLGIDGLLFFTSYIIGIIGQISITLKIVLFIIMINAIILYFILWYIGKRLEKVNKGKGLT